MEALREFFKTIGWWAALLGIILGIAYGIDRYQSYRKEAQLEAQIQEVKEAASKADPKTSRSEALAREVVKRTEEMLSAEPNAYRRRDLAAYAFMATYLSNTRARTQLCGDEGVDIQSFVSEYRHLHARELQRAREILGADAEDKLYAQHSSRYAEQLNQAMADLAMQEGTSVKGACQLISKHGPAFAKQVLFSQTQPKMYAALFAVK